MMLEYTKRCDPDLPFYQYTGGNECYSIGPANSFNEPSASGLEWLDKVKISNWETLECLWQTVQSHHNVANLLSALHILDLLNTCHHHRHHNHHLAVLAGDSLSEL